MPPIALPCTQWPPLLHHPAPLLPIRSSDVSRQPLGLTEKQYAMFLPQCSISLVVSTSTPTDTLLCFLLPTSMFTSKLVGAFQVAMGGVHLYVVPLCVVPRDSSQQATRASHCFDSPKIANGIKFQRHTIVLILLAPAPPWRLHGPGMPRSKS